MIHATQQQLQLISQRTEQLELSVKSQVDEVKRLQNNRSAVAEKIETLRRELETAEATMASVDADLAVATKALRATAAEFSKAQLLQKKYRNTLAELDGHCRAYVLFRGGSPAGVSIPDPCTVDVGDKATFLFDSVSSGDIPADGFNTPGTVRDVLQGLNSALLAFGPPKTGKTTALFGPKGYVRRLIATLFESLEELEVTHFSFRVSMGEILMDQFTDHLADFGSSAIAMGSATDLRSIPVQSVEDTIRVLEAGLQRVGVNRRGVGHVFFAMAVENFNRRGDFRRGSLLFIDMVGTPSAHAPRTAENQWIIKSVSGFCTMLSQLATGCAAEAVVRQGALPRLLQEALGGNCKTSMLLVLSPNTSEDEMLSALTYASNFKRIVNSPTPYDIPSELQRLNFEATLD